MMNREINGQPKEITHVRYYMQQIENLERALNNEQMGRLFFAVADYARTGVREAVDGDILFPYNHMCNCMDKARGKEFAPRM